MTTEKEKYGQARWPEIRALIVQRMEDRGGSISMLAQELKVSPGTLWNYLSPKSARVPSPLAQYALLAWAAGFRPNARMFARKKREMSPAALAALAKARAVKAGTACPLCGSVMVLRARKADGGRFLGCTAYPACNGTRDLDAEGRPVEAPKLPRSAKAAEDQSGDFDPTDIRDA